MARVQFANKVKYSGEWYPAHTPFEAKNEDLNELVSKGAIVLDAVAPADEEEDEEEDTNTNSNEGTGNSADDQSAMGGSQVPPANLEDEEEEDKQENKPAEIPTKTELLNMTKAVITEYAATLGVDISKCTNGEQRVSAILAHFAK